MSDNESLEEHLAPYVSVENVIVQPVSTVSTMLFCHGIYLMIFGVCLHVLLRRREQPNRKLYLGWTISLFILATTLVVIQAYILIRQSVLQFTWAKKQDWESLLVYVQTDRLVTIGFTIGNLIPLLMNAIADSILIHRCYIIWDSRFWVAIPLCFSWFGINLVGLIAVILGSIAYEKASLDLLIKSGNLNTGYFIANVIINGIITLLTGAGTTALVNPIFGADALLVADRIWKINREAHKVVGYTSNPQLQRVMAIILESGALYPAFLIAYGVMQNTVATDTGIQPINLAPIVAQVAGIAPTLIIARAGMGIAAENVDQVLSTLDFAENRHTDSQLRTTDIERDDFNSSVSESTPDAEKRVHRRLDEL
ncbi:hypothetical protein VNI00_013049 [Paramarasmius palmivorus]|uniref:Gustatory receptor n=1 Tax=Paramarasmius palmivorus TaxID=297713 RepID=A0AAW0BZS7_9AGAR